MGLRYNPPPGWPPAPPGFLPGPGWRPDPSWPPAPQGWQVVVDDPTAPPTPAPPGSQASHGGPAPAGPQLAPQVPATDGFAVASLVTSLLGGTLVSIILGIVSLRRVRGGRRSGKGMAIAGIAIGTLSLVGAILVVLLLLIGLNAAEDGELLPDTAVRDGSGQIDGPRAIPSRDLRAGDCFMYPGADDPAGEVEEVGLVRAVPCTQAHDAQVFHVSPRLTGDRPSEDALAARAEETCTTESEKRLDQGAVTDTMEIASLFPTTTAWLIGDRSIQCVVVEPKGGLTASLLVGS